MPRSTARTRFLGACGVLAAMACWAVRAPDLFAQEEPLSVHITSPLGRTGLPATIRIVAQVYHRPSSPPPQIRFYVDNQLLQSVNEGPPYAVEWVDDRPFERREISVEAVDALGTAVWDTVVLEPFEVIEAADVASVVLDTSVRNADGGFVKDLDVSAFSIWEDGELQSIDLARQESVGATFALLIDSSDSMSRRLDFVQRTATTLSGFLGANDRMVIAPFTQEIGAITGPTNDRATISESIRAIKPNGGTAILDALTNASRLLGQTNGRRAIVLLTDGYDEDSSTSFEDALGAVKSAGATLYVVGIGGVAGISIKGERLLRRLALETGGRFFFPARQEQLADVDRQLAEDVQTRYLLAYTPLNQKLDGTWRSITVTSSDPSHEVRTKPGYFAPKPPPIRATLEFTALDPSGRYLDLSVEDLHVLEDGHSQDIETFQEAVDPVSIVLALDASGSMAKKEADVVASAREFISALRDQDRLALMLFADSPVFAQNFSTNHRFFIEALGDYRANGGTALYDAIVESLDRLKRVEGRRRVVVVMTDGRDENNPGTAPGSINRLEDVAREIQETGSTVFAIGLGVNVDSGPLQQIADLSGGRAFFPKDVSELSAEFNRVVDDLRRRYVVGYTSSQIQRDGSWREVTIQVKSQENAVVTSPGGYFAPSR